MVGSWQKPRLRMPKGPKMTNPAACLMGALVADAAALGLHWIYDPARIDAVAKTRGAAAFTPINPAHFDGVPAYFAHGQRQNGALTQYGEALHLMIQSLIATNGSFNESQYHAAYAAHFGPGGTYIGYIDRPTRGTLANLAAGQTGPSGVDDDQLPATATLPAIILATLGHPDATATVHAAIRVTNVNDTATAYGLAFTNLLTQILNGTPLARALKTTADAATGSLGADLQQALSAAQSSTDYAETTGRACHLPMALPLAFHILANTSSFAAATEANIRAGGDSAGRAILIGAVLGAVHGIGGETGIPADYLLNLQNAGALWQNCQSLANLRRP